MIVIFSNKIILTFFSSSFSTCFVDMINEMGVDREQAVFCVMGGVCWFGVVCVYQSVRFIYCLEASSLA